MPTTSNTSRIAKNTLLLYFRMLLTMGVSLYTSRVILNALGVENYGIYNVVGGVVAMFGILSGSLSSAISRFITFELGKGDLEKLKRIFCTSVNIQVILIAIITILMETIGIWFLNNKMVIPEERLAPANWVFQFSVITFALNLLSVPYNAVIIAHEKMSAFAYISIIDVTLKLIVAFIIAYNPFDKLVYYGLLIMIVGAINRSIYTIYCKRHFEEATYRIILDKDILKNMFTFIGWAFWGNGSVVLKDQGTNILLNIFRGTAMNAARGVAGQVNNAINSFVTNFLVALNPQIIKEYAQGNYQQMHKLVIYGQKFGFFIMVLMLIPICANIDFILSIWLVEVPAHTANLIVLILLYSLAETFVTPLCTGVLAQGEIKNYEIALTIIYIVNFVVSYIVLKLGAIVEIVFALNIFFKMLIGVALLLQSRNKYFFPIKKFIKEGFLPTTIVLLSSATIVWALNLNCADNLIELIAQSLANIGICLVLTICIGLNKVERKFIFDTIKNKIKERK